MEQRVEGEGEQGKIRYVDRWKYVTWKEECQLELVRRWENEKDREIGKQEHSEKEKEEERERRL